MYASGGGVASRLVMWKLYTVPRWPPRTRRRASWNPASKRRWKPICTRPFVLSTWSTTRLVDSRSSAIGFSQKTARPSSSARRMSSACVPVGVTITAASAPARAASMDVACFAPRVFASAAARPASASLIRSSSTPGSSRRTLAWNAPRRPTPRIAIFTRRDSKLRISLTQMKLAAAPISWGVCEVPNWGLQLAPARVLGDMRALGVHATEAGPPGFLPADPAAARALLDSYGLRLVGGFVTAVLHESARRADELASVKRQAEWLAAGGAEVLVLAPALPQTGYSGAAEIGDAAWPTLFDGIDRVDEIANTTGLGVAVHPHWGTAIERPQHIERFLEGSAHALCLDTGHIALGGADPLKVARDAGPRVRHVHLKDVDGPLAAGVRSGAISYNDAVRQGLFRPLGEGAARIRDVLGHLKGAGYAGWYVLEQDVMLDAEPTPGPPGWIAESAAFARQNA